jgi:hypothetical protein
MRLRAIISTGVLALVDDTILRRLSHRQRRLSIGPLLRSSPLKLDVEFLGPRRFIDEILGQSRTRRRLRRSIVST